MSIKNGRYKDSKGVIRHFETNENMVVVDDGQKTLKQKLKEIKDRVFTKNDVGLSNVDNTSDIDKPVSTSVQEVVATLQQKDTQLQESVNSLTTTKSDKTYVDTQDRALDSKITVLSDKIKSLHPETELAYGVEVDLEASTVVRIGKAVGMSLQNFENVAPWNGELVIIDGQHMKKIPKFYYKREILKTILIPQSSDSNEIGFKMVKWRDYISPVKLSGFEVEPAFARNGQELPYFGFSRFEGSIFDKSANKNLLEDEQVADFAQDLLCSIPNAKPCSGKTQLLTIENARKLAQNRNTSTTHVWGQQDFDIVTAIQRMITIGCGNFDCQASVGKGAVDIPDTPNTENNSLKTGSTANMGMTCGNAGVDGKSSVNFFGIENFWGNIWKFVDGIVIEAKTKNRAWVNCDDLTIDTTNNKKNLGFTLSKSSNYISGFGEHGSAYLPCETKGGNVLSKDYFYQNSAYNGFLIALLGGRWSSGAGAGCFCWSVDSAGSNRNRHIGARLCLYPKL